MQVHNIKSISFGFMSSQDVQKLSVVALDNPRLNGANSVYDERMGVMKMGKTCVSCDMDIKQCTGHFGHIQLNYPVLHPLCSKYIVLFLRCFCFRCSRLVLSKEQLSLHMLGNFKKIVDKIEKTGYCFHCNMRQPDVAMSSDVIMMSYKKKNERKIQAPIEATYIQEIFDKVIDDDVRLLGMDPEMIHPRNLVITHLAVIPPRARPYVNIDGVVSDDDLTTQYIEIIKNNNNILTETTNVKKERYISTLNFRIRCLMDNTQGKAKHSSGRPYKCYKKRISNKDGIIRNNIMGKRVNLSARTVIGPDPTLRVDEVAIPRGISKILVYRETVTSFNIGHLTGLVERGNVSYVLRDDNRINMEYALQTKGTVLQANDLIVRATNEMVYDERVSECDCDVQRDGERRLVKKGNVLDVGDLITTKYIDIERLQKKKIAIQPGDRLVRNGEEIENVTQTVRKRFKLRIGDIVERHLMDGDIVLLNRQPTLHKASMLAKKIVVRDCKTFRLNLASTSCYNADFDGDEMNAHAPASVMTECELRMLSSTQSNFVSAQAGKSNIKLIQDALLGSFLMTRSNEEIPREIFFNICMTIHDESCVSSASPKYMSLGLIWERLKTVERVFARHKVECPLYSGKALVSLILPPKFRYEKKTGVLAHDPVVRIEEGVMYAGVLSKGDLAGGHGSILMILALYEGLDVACNFVNNIQYIANEWMYHYGFSIGLKDCLAKSSSLIGDSVLRCFIEARHAQETIHHPLVREISVNAALSKAKDIGMRIAKNSLDPDNGFISTVVSGSKGDFFNIAQITGLLGQQNLMGGRISPMLYGDRTLYHYPFEITDVEMEYESRGFIRNSFIHGLNPMEFFFHAMSGREGCSDTSMKTSTTGYIQRKMVKLMEDLQVKYDGTVRETSGAIVQFTYGEDGLDAGCTDIVDGVPQICDIGRLVDQINTDYMNS
jgi:DNA-directed RNA polymerase beta' subunit